MALTKLGKYIEQRDLRNTENKLGENSVVGISTQKEMISTKADLMGVSLTSYKLVPPNHFAYVPDTSRRGDKMSLCFNNTEKTHLVSSISIVFHVANSEKLSSDYLYIYFNRPEFDRYARFNSWGSARETFTWEDMCDIDIELPSLAIQQKYVDVYKAMLANQKSYERGLDDLKLTCDAYIENLRREMPCEKIGDIIRLSEDRNDRYQVKDNKAVSIEKVFVNAHADLNGVDIGNYYVVKKGQFAYNTVTTRNGDKISIAYNVGNDCLVSPIYTVFDVKEEKILPEYLMLWFKRSEFDRYSRFHSWGSAREMFTIEDMKNVKIPLPSISVQRSISDMYIVLMERRTINEKLKAQLKDICPILIKGALEEARQEDAHG